MWCIYQYTSAWMRWPPECLTQERCNKSIFADFHFISESVARSYHSDVRKFKAMQPVSSWRFLGQTALHLFFAFGTGFQSMLESKTKFLLSVSVRKRGLLALSVCLIYSRYIRPPGNVALPLTDVYCVFHLSIRRRMVNVHFLTLHQSETNFRKRNRKENIFLTLFF